MATKTRARQIKKGLRNVDDILFIFTGKRLKHVAGKAISLFGEDLAKKAANFFTGPEEPELPPDSPYSILGIHPDAMDIVVKASYKALMKRFHPDAEQPDEEKTKAINGAYEAICKERGISR